MTVQQPWNPTFSDGDPDQKLNTFFTGLPQNFYIRIDRDATSHQGNAPIVTANTAKVGGSSDQNDIGEGQTIVLSGNSCTLTAYDPSRQPGETVQVRVTVTWQPDPF